MKKTSDTGQLKSSFTIIGPKTHLHNKRIKETAPEVKTHIENCSFIFGFACERIKVGNIKICKFSLLEFAKKNRDLLGFTYFKNFRLTQRDMKKGVS